ncbi:MAG TPA: DUF167 domain-containing protein [Pyrinomonadaceae bacterium]
MIGYREEGGALVFAVRVAPRASKTEAAGEHGGALKVRVAAPPVEGAANEELTRFLAKSFGVPARAVEIVGGRASKTKVVRAEGAKAADLVRLAAG